MPQASSQSDDITDMEGKSQTLYTAPCNGIVSHGAPIHVLADQTQAKYAHDLPTHACSNLTRCVGFQVSMSVYLHAQKLHYMQGTFTPDESQENPNTPNWSPMLVK